MKIFDHLTLDGSTLRQLVELNETRSVTRAATRLGMTQSSLSYSLERARKTLADQLYIRVGNSIEPTERMLQILPVAHRILRDYDTLAMPASYLPEQDVGTLKIAANALERDLLVKPMFNELRKLAPGMTLELRSTGSWLEVRENLRNRNVDLALFPTLLKEGGDIVQRKLVDMEMAVFYDSSVRSAPQTLTEYCAANHAVVSHGEIRSSGIDQLLAEQGLKRNIALRVSDFDSLGVLLKGTDLIVCLPSMLQSGSLGSLSTACPPLPVPPMCLALFVHESQLSNPRLSFWSDKLTRGINLKA
ncbi:LysR family transcriptional regulator [Pseudovibrio sp. Ad13]|uniref:LysR family transcriptional regulator n=1 Tax=Pseudovibrio sp. Ad13 TaxID=989396 RepID=UPI0007AE9D61|nr:LysR family transcriptional regulator [Pseudovibrio sp. Ad13]